MAHSCTLSSNKAELWTVFLITFALLSEFLSRQTVGKLLTLTGFCSLGFVSTPQFVLATHRMETRTVFSHSEQKCVLTVIYKRGGCGFCLDVMAAKLKSKKHERVKATASPSSVSASAASDGQCTCKHAYSRPSQPLLELAHCLCLPHPPTRRYTHTHQLLWAVNLAATSQC